MSGETTKRRWYLIIRREGHAAQKIPVTLRLVRDGNDINPYAPQPQISEDFDILDNLTDLDTGEGLVGSYELISTTTTFDINSYE